MAEINVVPYIDVMLVLLLIFMITTPLLTQGVQVDLPQAEAKPITRQEQEPIIVSIDANGNYYLNCASHPNQPVVADQLVRDISQALQKTSNATQSRQILIKGDKKVDYGRIVQAMVLLQKAGIENVGLITDMPMH